MVQCAVEGCSSRSDTVAASSRLANSIHFHRVPKDPNIRKKWMKAINKHDIKYCTRICSLHFKKEDYYSTKLGFRKLVMGSVPDITLPQTITKYDTIDSSEGEAMSNVQPSEQNIDFPSQPQQSSPKDKPPEIETEDKVSGALNIKSEDESKSGITDSSEDAEMSDVQSQEKDIHLHSNCQQSSEEKTTDKVSNSSIIKPGIQKHKVKTPLERKLLKEVKRLREQGEKKMEAIHCLLEQNRRLLERNSFLEKALETSKKGAENVHIVEQQESLFFKIAAVTPKVSESNG